MLPRVAGTRRESCAEMLRRALVVAALTACSDGSRVGDQMLAKHAGGQPERVADIRVILDADDDETTARVASCVGSTIEAVDLEDTVESSNALDLLPSLRSAASSCLARCSAASGARGALQDVAVKYQTLCRERFQPGDIEARALLRALVAVDIASRTHADDPARLLADIERSMNDLVGRHGNTALLIAVAEGIAARRPKEELRVLIGTGVATSGDGSYFKDPAGRPYRSVVPPQTNLRALTVQGGLARDSISARLSEYDRHLAHCYEAEHLRAPNLGGTVKVTFTIDGHGMTATTEQDASLRSVAACVGRVVQTIAFPEPRPKQRVAVSFELELVPARYVE